ncbi:MAG: DUF2188 domain-containing protein, partial [Clostridia bacterium]|nr:DUF2188 domain-containing protein [Clostridia bacterium]
TMCFFSKEKREERKRKKEEKKLLRQQKKEEKLKAKQGKSEQAWQPVQEQPVKEKVAEKQEQPVAAVEEQADGKEEIVIESKESDGKKERPINYHISRREDGKWQVKRAKGGRALKLFSTQAEAISFAKERATSMDASITIHKKDGKIRKQKYGKKN